MSDLIEALQIFLKYKNEQWPTHCGRGVMMIIGVELEEVSEEDKIRLKELGFFWSKEYDCWSSFRFGTA